MCQWNESVNTHASRRGFLRGRFRETALPRPPGAGAEFKFQDICDQCGACARACPERIVRRDGDGFPILDFTRGACTFCGDCTAACETGALSGDAAWPWKARISAGCLSLRAVQCRACQDHCDEGAIRFRLIPGGKAEPETDAGKCTGCGGCIAPCPVGAISIERTSVTTEVRPC